MRIIRTLLVVMIIVNLLATSRVTSAAIAEESNETKINAEIDNNSIRENEVVTDGGLYLSVDTSEKKITKTPREMQVEKVRAKYADRRSQAKYPEGKFEINASAYTAAADECGKSDGITASGLKVEENETIACPPQFPFGTEIYIEGHGTYMCQDRGGAIKGNKIDIYMETKKEAFAFGRQRLLAEVVK